MTAAVAPWRPPFPQVEKPRWAFMRSAVGSAPDADPEQVRLAAFVVDRAAASGSEPGISDDDVARATSRIDQPRRRRARGRPSASAAGDPTSGGDAPLAGRRSSASRHRHQVRRACRAPHTSRLRGPPARTTADRPGSASTRRGGSLPAVPRCQDDLVAAGLQRHVAADIGPGVARQLAVGDGGLGAVHASVPSVAWARFARLARSTSVAVRSVGLTDVERDADHSARRPGTRNGWSRRARPVPAAGARRNQAVGRHVDARRAGRRAA